MPSAKKTRSLTHAWYALRRTLPPWRFEENLKELVRYLPRYGVNEVIVKVDTEEFSHGQPPVKWVRAYQKNLFAVKKAMDSVGILYSLNPWITVGHNDRGRDSRKMLPGLQTVVGHDGTQCAVCACPLSTVWRNHVAKLWTLYAETAPHVIWIEDDIRTFNHRPVTYSCFCPEHMRMFSRRVGQKVSREELVSAILKSGRPHRWRAEYLDMQAEIMIDTVAFLAKVVHKTNPETSLGLMSSGPLSHCLEGRRWRDFAEAFADGRPAYSRPPMGNYSEDSLRGFYYSHDSIKLTRHCMPADTIEQTEVESVPFTRYSKSVAFTFVEIALSFAYGSHGVTMNLFDHCGTPMESEPWFGRMLAEKKPMLNVLARRCQTPGYYRGVRLLFHEKASYHKRLPKLAAYGALVADGHQGMHQLESHGIPTTYEDSDVIATSGQTVRACSDAELERMLSSGLLLDGMAAYTLLKRGFGPQLGLKSIREPVCLDNLGPYSAEEFYNRKFGGSEQKYLTLTIPGLGGRPGFAVMEPVRGAQVISRIVDPDAKRGFPSMYAFENKLGGRVVVSALEIGSSFGVAYCHPFRAEQLRRAVQWLAHGRFPIMVRGGVYPLAFRKDCGAFSVLGLFNLTLDPWEYVEFDLFDKRRPERIEALTPKGQWRKSEAVTVRKQSGRHCIVFGKPVAFDEPLFLTVHWSRG